MAEKNRFCIVSTFYSKIGGISNYVRNIIEFSKKDGFKVIVISPNINKNSQSEELILVSSNRLLSFIETIYQLMRNNISSIQCHGAWYLLLSCVCYKYIINLRGNMVRLTTIKHSDININKFSIKRLLLQFIDNRADNVVFVSEYLKRRYIEDFGFCFSNQIYVVSPGVGVVQYRQESVDKLALQLRSSSKYPLLTYIGLFDYMGKVEGLLFLLQSIHLLKPFYPKIFLAIAGRGPLKWKVVEEIKKLALQEFVQIIETIDNPYELLKLSDLHCHVSFQDSFSIVVLEALNSGIPVIASPIGDLPNIAIDGLIIVNNSLDDLVRAILKNVGDPPKVNVVQLQQDFRWENKTAELNTITFSNHAS